MLGLKTIKKRISSVKSTQKITKAMKMVAAAKLRRAQKRAQNARFYTDAISSLARRLSQCRLDEPNPLTQAREKIVRREYLILTSDRGLCGGFNSNLLRRVGDLLEKNRLENIAVECRMIGKKGRDYFKSKRWELKEAVTDLYDNLEHKIAEQLGDVAIRHFLSGKTDEVWIVFNYFKSMMTQEVTVKKILPIVVEPSRAESTENQKSINYIFEPSQEAVLDFSLRESVVANIYAAFLESIASELAARMAAMENATSNASDMIEYYTLQYNRARQASITRELMDIVNGAEALK